MFSAVVILLTCLLENGNSYVTPLQGNKHIAQQRLMPFIERTKQLSVLQNAEETVEETVSEEETTEVVAEATEEVAEETDVDMMKLYLGGLPTTYDTEKIRELMEPFCEEEGAIINIAVPTDRFTGSPRGFAFIEIAKEAGAKAIESLHESEVEGQVVKCNEQLSKEELSAKRGEARREEPGTKIYVGNISFETTQEELRALFEEYGPVEDCYLPVDRNTGYKRGFAFLRMLDEEKAQEAIEKLNGSEVLGRMIEVNVSLPRGEAPPRRRTQTRERRTKIYIGNLPFDTTLDSIVEVFSDYGTVIDCYLPTDMDTGRSRGFGFVTMSAEDAPQAIDELDGIDFGGRQLRINEAQPKARAPRDYNSF